MDVSWYCQQCGFYPDGSMVVWDFLTVADAASHAQVIDAVRAHHTASHPMDGHLAAILVDMPNV